MIGIVGGEVEGQTKRPVAAANAETRGRSGPRVLLRVTNTGEGTEEELRSQVFEPFFTTKGGKAIGLGLATQHSVEVQSRGSISVESAPGHGTMFTVDLPASRGIAPEWQPVPVRGPHHGTEKIHPVEVARSLRRILDGD